MKNVYIADFREGLEITDEVFALEYFVSKKYKSKPGMYLELVLLDKTGRVNGQVWDISEEAIERISGGHFIKVTGRVNLFNEKMQVTITKFALVDPAQIQPEDFLPVTPQDRNELMNEIHTAIEGVTNPFLRRLLDEFWSDSDWLENFQTAPAAKMHHQPYIGGLLEHTANIVRLIPAVCTNYPEADRDLLTTGAILHDIGKIQEYQYEMIIDITDEGHFLGHIVLGLKMAQEAIARISDFPKELELKVLHMITSHHGQYEWQSPRRPKIIEACLLHHLDLMDGEAFKFSRALNSEGSGNWVWEKTLDRWVYIGE